MLGLGLGLGLGFGLGLGLTSLTLTLTCVGRSAALLYGELDGDLALRKAGGEERTLERAGRTGRGA